jgi:hypothetical protein
VQRHYKNNYYYIFSAFAAFDGDDAVAFDAEDYCDDSDGDDFMCMVMPQEWGVSGISALPRWS